MNEFFYQTVIEDHKKEVSKIVEDNQIHKHLRDSPTSQRESAGKGKSALSLWLLMVAKRLKGVYTINIMGSDKV